MKPYKFIKNQESQLTKFVVSFCQSPNKIPLWFFSKIKSPPRVKEIIEDAGEFDSEDNPNLFE